MNQSSSNKLAAVVFLLLLLAFNSLCAADHSLSLFQYATPLEMNPVFSAQLAELRFSQPIYNALRDDFADLRVVLSSNHGVVPVRVVRLNGPEYAPVSRPFTLVEEIPTDLLYRYPQSVIVLVDTGRVPLTDMTVALDRGVSGGDYLLLGQGAAHATGTEWRLLKHLRGADDQPRINFTFEESSFTRYAFIAESGRKLQFEVESVSGPDYCAYFEIQPGAGYTLLCGYSDALPVSGLNAETIDRHLEKGEQCVQIRVSELVENASWKSRSLKGFVFRCSFLIPLAVVIGVVVVLLGFVVVYTFVNRKRPIQTGHLPRFFK